ncbi:MAG: DUF3572 family protein [Roseinatronobacter sp.]
MTLSEAREIAQAALVWLCGDEALLPVFLAASGAEAADLAVALRTGAYGDGLIAQAALDFVLMRDQTVITFCMTEGLPHDRPAMAQAVLAGPVHGDWA